MTSQTPQAPLSADDDGEDLEKDFNAKDFAQERAAAAIDEQADAAALERARNGE